jgi:hypothetical protein
MAVATGNNRYSLIASCPLAPKWSAFFQGMSVFHWHEFCDFIIPVHKIQVSNLHAHLPGASATAEDPLVSLRIDSSRILVEPWVPGTRPPLRLARINPVLGPGYRLPPARELHTILIFRSEGESVISPMHEAYHRSN